MEVKEVKFLDGSGGLNNRDQPSQIQQNEFTKLENLITDDGGWPGKKRLGQLLMQYAPIEPEPFQGVLTITALSGPGPGLITITCADTSSLRVGMSLTFYNAVPAILGASVIVASILNATQFTGINTVAFAVGNKFKQSGTLHLYHMNTLAGADPDDTIFEIGSPYAIQTEGPFGQDPTTKIGLFPAAGPLSRQGISAPDGTFLPANGGGFSTTFSDLINGLGTIFFEAWIYINPSFTGKPVVTTNVGGTGISGFSTNSGTHILATAPTAGFGSPGNSGEARNGLSIFRDWDAANNTDAGDPYLTLTLRTTGSGKQVLTSKALPTATWIFVRGSYISGIGKIRLRVSGELQAEVVASGTIDDNAGFGVPGSLYAASSLTAVLTPVFSPFNTGFDGRVEEMRIRTGVTQAEEELSPFKEGRGKPWPLVKSNGSKQLIVGAGDSMFYTVGDGAWVKMNDAAQDVLGPETFSSIADWDAIQVGDSLFLQNGTDAPKTWDGLKLYPWGNPVSVPTLALGGAPGIGGPLGVHSYYMTFLYGTIETGPSPVFSITTTAVGQSVSFTAIPIGAPGCTGRKIYRVKIGGANAGRRYLFRQISDNATTALTAPFVSFTSPLLDTGNDGLPDATLSTGAYVEMTAAVQFSLIPKGKYLLANNNRGWITGGDDQYSAFYTELNAMHTCLPLSYVRATSDSGPLIGLAKYYGETQASKGGKATLVLRGDNPSNWTQWEILHPTVGAIDHWSYVHRTIPGSDSYRLCFMGEDGAYSYAGQDFEKISDLINGTISTLAASNGNRQAIIVTTKTDWESAAPPNAGFISKNAYAPIYETDGLRDFPGQMRSVDQLNYLGLRSDSNPMLPGNIIAVAKGVNEGEFFFSTDSSKELYFTPDNFFTAAPTVIAGNPLAAGERIIEIVRRGINDFWFILTDTAGTLTFSGGGKAYAVSAPTTVPVWTVGVDTLYYDLDVPIRMDGGAGGPIINGKQGRVIGEGAASASLYSPFNAFINHGQDVVLTRTQNNFVGTAGDATTRLQGGGTSISSFTPSNLFTVTQHGTNTISPVIAVAPGFIGADCFKANSVPVGQFDIQLLRLDFTRREGPAWRGGTFRPQAVWDGTRLVFLASDPEISGNRLTKIRSYNAALTVLTTFAGPTRAGALAFSASPSTYYWSNHGVPVGPSGFNGEISSGAIPGTQILSSGALVNSVITRLGFERTSSNILYAFKYFQGAQDFWTYTGYLRSTSNTFAVTNVLQNLVANGDSGAMYQEFVKQTNNPAVWFVFVNQSAIDNILAVQPAMAVPADISVYEGAGYKGATGILSNAIFVVSSGAPNYLWADRLYFFVKGGAANKLVQLGVPGDWKVRVNYTSQIFSPGVPSSFDAFQTDFQGSATFFLRNAALAGSLPGSEQIVSPNQNISVFSPPQALIQFRLFLDWDYSIAFPVVAVPYIENVQIGYFLGLASLPRVVGWHWKGRTYWSVAQVGQARNNLVLVYQKNGRWTTYTGWNIKGTAEFLGRLVALQGFELVQIEVGNKDKGRLIRTKSRTGSIMDEATDKCLRDFNFNLLSYVNNNFPTKSGYMQIAPVGAGQRLNANWLIEIPATPAEEPRQVYGFSNPPAPFPYAYARAFALEIFTSEDTLFPPAVDQDEKLAGLIVRFFVSSPRILIVRP